MHGREDMDLTTSIYSLNITKTKMREFARQHGIYNPIDIGLNKWGLERRMMLEEERARKAERQETRVQMQVLNKHVAALCASECLESFFSLSDFKCNTVMLLTDCILYRDWMQRGTCCRGGSCKVREK